MNLERLGVLLVRLFCLHLLVEAPLIACTSLPVWWDRYHAVPNYGSVVYEGHSLFMGLVRICLEAGAGVWLYQHAIDVVRMFTRDVPEHQQEDSGAAA